jgi:glycine/D-amino acid oxidase-like deaminating enzyme
MSKPYPDYQLACGWNALLPVRQAQPSLHGEQQADVVIIGAGWTGLACARRWQELAPDARVVVIDASEIGEGNPGRNSGFLLEVALAEDADPANISRMHECNRLIQEAMQTIAADVQAYGQPVDLERAGTYRAAVGEVGLKSLHNYKAFLEGAGLPYRQLDRAALKAELGTEFYTAGLYSPHCYLAQPAEVMRAILARLPGSVQLYENTPATGIKRVAGKWQVTTPFGSLHSPRLVLANNAFTRDLGVARSRLATVYTYAGLTPRLDEKVLESLGSNHNWGILPTHRLGSTLRRTADGRLLVRSLHDYGQERGRDKLNLALQDRLWRRFPQVKGIPFEHIWGGAVGITYNGAPVWGEVEPGLFASSGCNGGGTVKGTLLGQLLAELALGHEVPDIASLFGSAAWMPPEPFRGIGFHAISRLESWQGRQEL